MFTAARRASLPTYDHTLGSPTEACGIEPMYERQVASVRIRYRYGAGSTDYYDDYALNSGHPDYARAITVYVDSPDQDQADDANDSNVASKLLSALMDLSWSGKLDLHETSAPLPWYLPGAAINLVGGVGVARPEWATIGAIVQSVRHHVGAETTDTCAITFGAPEHLGLQDWFELSDIAYSSSTVVGDPGGQDPDPPPYAQSPITPGGTYSDLENNTPSGAPGGGLEFQSRSGTCSLMGYAEYMTPSTPPKKFLTRAFSGVSRYHTFSESPCAGIDTVYAATFSGADSYVGPSTITRGGRCVINDGGAVTTVDSSNAIPLDIASLNPGGFMQRMAVERSRRRLWFLRSDCECGVCYAGAPQYSDCEESAESLTTEDTEESAADRMLAANPWPETWSGAGALAAYEARVSGFDFQRSIFRYRGEFTACGSWKSLQVTVRLQSRAFGSSDSWESAGERVVVILSDYYGNVTLPAQEVDAERGREVRVGEVAIQQL